MKVKFKVHHSGGNGYDAECLNAASAIQRYLQSEAKKNIPHYYPELVEAAINFLNARFDAAIAFPEYFEFTSKVNDIFICHLSDFRRYAESEKIEEGRGSFVFRHESACFKLLQFLQDAGEISALVNLSDIEKRKREVEAEKRRMEEEGKRKQQITKDESSRNVFRGWRDFGEVETKDGWQ